MARKVVVEVVDDFDGTSFAEETVRFAIDGVAYEMDLSAPNAAELRAVLQPWVSHARKVGGRRPRGKKRTEPASDRERSAAIREWARTNGYEVSNRGVSLGN
ncbi:histone-like nucleoid-structuring protein Lsr2 [Nocardia amamiensis]|uniref:histone-like nucleoid-structuring protein Lsr2 n=1 Tax=Nocardia amamiensis TaxID=404578 RepID=UPI003F7DFA43